VYLGEGEGGAGVAVGDGAFEVLESRGEASIAQLQLRQLVLYDETDGREGAARGRGEVSRVTTLCVS
jgi:hypothetical protein